MTEQRCERSDLPVDQCAHCKEVELPNPTDGLHIARRHIADFDTKCAIVGRHGIMPGDIIGLAVQADDTTQIVGWVCERCTKEIEK